VIWDWGFSLRILPKLLSALVVTVEATVLGMSLALVLGLVWAVLRRSSPPLVAVPARWTVEFIRSTPLLVQIYFLFFVLPDSIGVRFPPLTTGVLALGLHYSTYTSEVYRAGIDAVPKGQWEAAIALNMSPLRTWLAIVLPQAIRPIIPALGNYLVAMFKDTPLLAAITVLELLQTAKVIGAETFRYLEPLTLVGVLFLVLSLLSSRLVRGLEVRFAKSW
jgi:polar amino acid transport system permease protein